MKSTSSKRFICFRPNPEATRKMICFPPAGIGASFYSKWFRRVPDFLEVWAAQLPQREYLAAETLPDSLAEVMALFYEEVEEILDGEFDIYGHSFGAAQAFTMATWLEAKGINPNRLVLAARKPIFALYENPLSQLSKDDLIAYLIELGGMPQNLLADEALLNKFIDLVRKDLSLNEDVDRDVRPLKAPIEFVYSYDDVALNLEEAKSWARLTLSQFRLHEVEGDHFFVNDESHPFYKNVLGDSKEVLETL